MLLFLVEVPFGTACCICLWGRNLSWHLHRMFPDSGGTLLLQALSKLFTWTCTYHTPPGCVQTRQMSTGLRKPSFLTCSSQLDTETTVSMPRRARARESGWALAACSHKPSPYCPGLGLQPLLSVSPTWAPEVSATPIFSSSRHPQRS